MEFFEEETVLEVHRSVLAEFKGAVNAGWGTEQLATANIHVRIDTQGRDLIVFDIYDRVSKITTPIEFAVDESRENVLRRTRDAFANFLPR